MNKIIPLAAAIAVFPLTQKKASSDLNFSFFRTGPVKLFAYKNTITTNPFSPEKKIAEPWSQNWMDQARENIRKREYHFTWEEKRKAYCTPNRKNNLRFFYTDKGFSVEPRTTKIPVGGFDPMKKPDEINYKTIPGWKVKFSLDKKQVGPGSWRISENKAEYNTPGITVQYINNEAGMRQNFIVYAPRSKKKILGVRFRVSTKLKTVLFNNRLQFFQGKNAVLQYSDLNVWDARGKNLDAWIEKDKSNTYVIKINTAGAVYPVTIDPISTTPSIILESNQAASYFGISVASAGDVNGDGYSDVIIGAHQYDNGETDEGAAFVYRGSPIGIITLSSTILECDQAFARMGISVSSAGDVNGDGYSDVIVGASRFDNGETDEGAAFIYHGSASGINPVPFTLLECNVSNSELGTAVASAGDVNGDGYSDVITGAPLYHNGETDEGMAAVYLGSAGGVISTPVLQFESNQANASLGNSVASAGDVNGDGYSDFLVGAYAYDSGESNEGVAMVFHGSASGPGSIPVAILECNQADAYMGVSVACTGDLNGDGYSDVVVGANLYDNGEADEGAAFVYYGSITGINPFPSLTLESNQVNANMGQSAASAGDVNADGYSDLVVSSFYYDNGQQDEGIVYIYQGSASGISVSPTTVLENNQANAHFGRCVASAGDVNGDGYSDLVVGSHLYDNGQTDEGGAFIYLGSAIGINTTASASVESNQATAQMGRSVAGAGDVNGDGYSDVIVGAWLFDSGQSDEGAAFIFYGSASGINTTSATQLESNQATAYFGFPVSGAGDVNGDGYSDVVVGSYNYDSGQTDEGAAFIFQGSASGVSPAYSAMVESNQTTAQMGNYVSSAGDLNGDGYGDVAIGAFNYDDPQLNEGAVFVYKGSSSGLNTTPIAILEGNQANERMGVSVALAGDVNGDGRSDLIAGAYFYTNGEANEGAAYVFLGTATGINTTPSVILESNQAGATFGVSVAGAGDINGDAYSDVVVGAYTYTNGQGSEGAAYVFLGSGLGINPIPHALLESNQGGARMGFSATGAGDVNGDGYSDILVSAYLYNNGESGEGVAFIYNGSASGLITTPATLVESNQVNADFGISVNGAGDVNGDGYSDVIIGAYLYDNGSTDEGGAFVFGGNGSGNLSIRNNLRLYNTDLSSPINNSNFFSGVFGAGLFAKSFLGRSKGKLVWETRLNFNPWSGTPITNSTLFTAQQLSYTDMGLAGIEIKNLIAKILVGGKFTKLRARIKYDPVTAITGQVYSPWRYVSSIIDANNLGVLPIELVSFNASWQQKGRSAKLEFKTDKESGICCFDIEKSFDGFNFAAIGSLPAKNIPGIQTYQFTDNNATNNKQYYRIKIKGLSGQTDYSNIQQLQNNGSKEILVFPNPTTDALQLQLNGTYSKMNVQVINAAGETVKQLNNLPVFNQLLRIPVNDLPTGHYWLKLQSGSDKQVLQFVKE